MKKIIRDTLGKFSYFVMKMYVVYIHSKEYTGHTIISQKIEMTPQSYPQLPPDLALW